MHFLFLTPFGVDKSRPKANEESIQSSVGQLIHQIIEKRDEEPKTEDIHQTDSYWRALLQPLHRAPFVLLRCCSRRVSSFRIEREVDDEFVEPDDRALALSFFLEEDDS